MTSRGKVDKAIYHPRYTGFKPKVISDFDEPLDMGWIFYPPAGEEWFKQPRNEEIEPKSDKLYTGILPEESSVTPRPLDTRAMRPYLSPSHPTEQTQPSHQGQYKWGSYKGKTASSYTKEHQQQSRNKDPHTTTDS